MTNWPIPWQSGKLKLSVSYQLTLGDLCVFRNSGHMRLKAKFTRNFPLKNVSGLARFCHVCFGCYTLRFVRNIK